MMNSRYGLAFILAGVSVLARVSPPLLSVDDAPVLCAPRRPSRMSVKGSRCEKTIGVETWRRVRKERCASSYSKAMNIGSGWVQK